jgi:Tol biopolymer transport system component
MADVVTRIAAMPSLPKFSLLGALVAAIALLALPVAAEATLVYVKNPFKPAVFAANDNGGGAFRVGAGTSPRVSPDGDAIAYAFESSNGKRQLKIAAAQGGGSATVMNNFQDTYNFAFSPDSKLIAALRGPELGKRTLVLLDVTSGTLLRKVDTGYFSGLSFSPDGTELAYAKTNAEGGFPTRINVFSVAIGGGKPVQLTKDNRSQNPVWGPNGKIAFVKLLGAEQRKYGPKNEIFLMNENGSAQKRLTHTKVGALLSGLTPLAWSANGTRLLTEFGGQDTSYAVTVNPQTGAQKRIGPSGEQGLIATALSKDGSTVLGFTGGFEPGPNHATVTVPYAGGKAKTLVKGGYEPDWSN